MTMDDIQIVDKPYRGQLDSLSSFLVYCILLYILHTLLPSFPFHPPLVSRAAVCTRPRS